MPPALQCVRESECLPSCNACGSQDAFRLAMRAGVRMPSVLKCVRESGCLPSCNACGSQDAFRLAMRAVLVGGSWQHQAAVHRAVWKTTGGRAEDGIQGRQQVAACRHRIPKIDSSHSRTLVVNE